MTPQMLSSGATATTAQQKVVTRLSPAQYKDLEKRCLPPDVNTQDTMLTAGVRLGVQQVLKLLREGFLVGE